MSLTQSALRATNRFYRFCDADAVVESGRFQNCIVLVFVFHTTICLYFLTHQFAPQYHAPVSEAGLVCEFVTPQPKIVSVSVPSSVATGQATEMSPVPKPAVKRLPPRLPPIVSATRTAIADQSASVKPPLVSDAGMTSSVTASEGAPIGTGTSAAGTGEGGDNGVGTGTGAGGDSPPVNPPKIASIQTGDIAPYRNDLLRRLGSNLHATRAREFAEVLIILDKAGQVVSSQIIEFHGSKRTKRDVLKAIENTKFAALPDWYRGSTLPFRIRLDFTQQLITE